MRLLRTASHHIAHLAYQKVHVYYQAHANNLESAQRRTLHRILKQYQAHGLAYEDFIQTYPLTGYIPTGDFPDTFDFDQHGSWEQPISIWQNSLHRIGSWGGQLLKLCIHPQSIFKHVDQAMALWMDDLYQQYPSLKHSSQYWMLSKPKKNKLNVEPLWFQDLKHLLNRLIQAVPNEITKLSSIEDMLYATAVYLVANKQLGLIAVKNAQLVTQLLDTIEQYQIDIIMTLRQGNWGRTSLKHLKVPISCEQSYKLERLNFKDPSAWQELWPELKVVAVWEHSAKWIELFKQRMQHAILYTQAMHILPAKITVPFGQYNLLNYHTYFFEFLNVQTQQVIASWQLKKGDIVRPIVTAGLGCIRCLINLELKITTFYQQIPCFSLVHGVHSVLEHDKKLGIREKIHGVTMHQLQNLIRG